jgi:hypothetical protein
VRFLCRFELADRVAGELAAADGVAADLVEYDQRDYGRGRGERPFIRLRPSRDAVYAQVAQLDRASGLWLGLR